MNYSEIIKEIIPLYLDLILSWPVAVLVIAFLIIFKYSEEIRNFIKNMSSVKWGPFEASHSQGPTEDVEEKVEDDLQKKGVSLTKEEWDQIENLVNQRDAQISQFQDALKATLERAENYEFAYLNLALVHNTKLALYWFTLQQSGASTKENFISLFPLPQQIRDPLTEKEAIFNALITNGLLIQDGGAYKTTDKGVKFLEHINFAKK